MAVRSPGGGLEVGPTSVRSQVRMGTKICQGPIALSRTQIIYKHSSLRGTRFLLSAAHIPLETPLMRYIEGVVKGWDLTKFSLKYNRIWVRDEGEVFAAILSRSELGKLAKASDCEIPDATRLVFKTSDGKLVSTTKTHVPDTLLNSDIRDQIFKCLSGESDIIPPPLFAVIDENGDIFLCNDQEGVPIHLPIMPNVEFMPYTLVCITLLSREQYQVTSYRGIEKIVKATKKPNEFPPNLLRNEVEESQTTAEPQPPLSSSSEPTRRYMNIESRAIQAWAFNGDELDPRVRVVERSLGAVGSIALTSKSGAQFFLPRLKDAYKRFRELHPDWRTVRVKILLQEEEIDEDPCKTARVYAPNIDPIAEPDRWFALFEFVDGEEKGDWLDTRLEFVE
ncbi:MAG: hypothetical protein HQ596_03475 [Candidatus Saganbacteria bacterium]|nr:hypothetical protein [Candidatus Saganbacteria bacterium]